MICSGPILPEIPALRRNAQIRVKERNKNIGCILGLDMILSKQVFLH